MEKTATFSKCRKYRYELWRIWGKRRPFVLFVCLNPSIADHKIDSRTSKRCIRFVQDWGYDALCMVNLFAFRSQNPKNLLSAIDPVGPDNDDWIIKLSSEADLVVAAWGNTGTLYNRDQQIIPLLNEPHCFGLTKKGCPRHPLYIPKNRLPKKWVNLDVPEINKQSLKRDDKNPIQKTTQNLQINMREEIMLGKIVYNVPDSYRTNGYILIKVGDRLLFPKPNTKIKLFFSDYNEPFWGEIRETTNNRIRLYGLRQWFSSLGKIGQLTVEIIPVEPMKTYRIRIR